MLLFNNETNFEKQECVLEEKLRSHRSRDHNMRSIPYDFNIVLIETDIMVHQICRCAQKDVQYNLLIRLKLVTKNSSPT